MKDIWQLIMGAPSAGTQGEVSMIRMLKFQVMMLLGVLAMLAMMFYGKLHGAPAPLPHCRSCLCNTSWKYTPSGGRKIVHVLRLRSDNSCDGGEAPGYSYLSRRSCDPFRPTWTGKWRYVGGDLFIFGRFPSGSSFREVIRIDTSKSDLKRLVITDRAVNGLTSMTFDSMDAYRGR